MGLVDVPLCDTFNVDKLLFDGLEINKVKTDLNNDVFAILLTKVGMTKAELLRKFKKQKGRPLH